MTGSFIFIMFIAMRRVVLFSFSLKRQKLSLEYLSYFLSSTRAATPCNECSFLGFDIDIFHHFPISNGGLSRYLKVGSSIRV